MYTKKYIFLIMCFILTACHQDPAASLSASPSASPQLALEKVAIFAIGDSLTAGTQDAATLDETQRASWLTLVAGQLSFIADIHYSYPALKVDGSRIDPKIIPTNFAIPGLEISEALEEKGEINLFEGIPVDIPEFVKPLGKDSPLTPLDALDQAMDSIEDKDIERWVFVWIGSNDIFFDFTKAKRISQDALNEFTPDPDQFAARFSQLLDRVVEENPDEVFVFPIPNLLRCGFLMSPEDLAFYLNDDGPRNHFDADDLIPLNIATEIIASHIMFNLPVQPMLDNLDDSSILDREEQEIIAQRLSEYNDRIRNVSESNGVTLMISVSKFDEWLENGVVLNDDRRINRSWSRGGMFSLDGVHPSNTGHGLIANAVIDEINELKRLNIPKLDLVSIYATDPYRDMDGDGQVAGPTWEAPPRTPAALLRLFVDENDSTE